MTKRIMCGFEVAFDAVAGWLGSYGGQDSPADIQRGVFAAEVGVPRLLQLFAKKGLHVSWFVPGHSIESFPRQVAAIVDGGHEVGAHGYTHENPIAMTAKQERSVLEKSIELIEKVSGKSPRGYVAPWWEMSESTIDLLLEHGFSYDKSQGYHDFLPFYSRRGDQWTPVDYEKEAEDWMVPMQRGTEVDLVNFGANWYTDDLPPLMFIKQSPNSHGWVNPRDVEQSWVDQFDWVHSEMDYAAFTFTIHPDVSGRPQVLKMVERVIDHINSYDGIEWMTFEEMAVDFRSRFPFPDAKGDVN